MIKTLRSTSLYFAWLIAIIALLVTLYSSEVLAMPVCHLCWYQRITIYPLAIILGIAAYREDYQIKYYAMPLAALAFLFGLYQYLEQMIPGFSPINLCNKNSGPICSQIHFLWLGFITYPFLSMLASLAIFLLLWIKPKKNDNLVRDLTNNSL